MPQTLTEKLLARAAGLGIDLPDESLRSVADRVKSITDARQITLADVDRLLGEALPPLDD